MRGRRPEPIPGVEPGRWRVVRSRGLSESERAWWYVYRERSHGMVSFPTWREAMDYADRMARTREVVLPRVAPQGEVSVSATWYCDQGAIHYINSAGQVVQGAPADLARHAATLLALAEQEESCRE